MTGILELRPHHVWGFLEHENNLHWYDLSDKEYIAFFRKIKGEKSGDQGKEGQHPDRLIIYWRNTIKKLHENPDIKFKYVNGLDSVCMECTNKEICDDEQHWAYEAAQKADGKFAKWTPELKYGRIYDGNFILKLFRDKDWLKK